MDKNYTNYVLVRKQEELTQAEQINQTFRRKTHFIMLLFSLVLICCQGRSQERVQGVPEILSLCINDDDALCSLTPSIQTV